MRAKQTNPSGRRSSAGHGITVILPAEPPELTPAAARILLKILLELTEQKRSTTVVP